MPDAPPPIHQPSNALQLTLQRGVGKSTPEQVFEQFQEWITVGRLGPGDRLPTLRSLARQVGTHPAQIARGLERLLREGWLDGELHGDLTVHATPPVADVATPEEKGMADAREVQRSFLPQSDLALPELHATAFSQGLHEISGDLHDWVADPTGRRWTFAVGDVAGKGMAAGLVMAAVQTAVRLSAANEDPARVLNELNVELIDRLRSRDFVALTLVRVDLDSGRTLVANAGSPDVYLLPRGGATDRPAHAIAVPGPRLPLGLRASLTYESREVHLTPGDTLLMLSDGLPETPTADGEDQLGYQRLEQRLAAQLGGNERPDLAAFVAALDREHQGRANDDRTLLWARYLGS